MWMCVCMCKRETESVWILIVMFFCDSIGPANDQYFGINIWYFNRHIFNIFHAIKYKHSVFSVDLCVC